MKLFHLLIPVILLVHQSCLGMSSYPYISGDTFRSLADHIFDERHRNFDPHHVRSKQIIFVKADFVEEFFARYHNQIPVNYILITHNSDVSIPGTCSKYLDDPKLIVWFGQNVSAHHPKLQPIPIGVANQCWPHGSTKILSRAQKLSPSWTMKNCRKKLLYLNMVIAHCVKARKHVFDLFSKKDFCFNAPRKEFESYLHEMSQFCFVVSPEGNGIDCHRTWEALYMGCVPVVKSHSLNQLYEDLPVLIVEQWEDVSEEFLVQKFESMRLATYRTEKLYADYWFNRIKSYQKG